MVVLYVLLGLLALCLLVCTGIAAYLFVFALGKQKPVDLSDKEKLRDSVWGPFIDKTWDVLVRVRARDCKDWSTTSADGTVLNATFVPCDEPSDRVLIIVHGWHGNRWLDFGPSLEHYLVDEKCNLLLTEQRAHGESECRWSGFGWLERNDCAAWAAYCRERLGENVRIVLAGISMGGRTVLLASELHMPGVLGICADCAPSDAWEQFAYVLKSRYHLPAFPIMHIADVFCRLFAHYSFRDGKTTDALSRATVPVFFLHGKADTFVPCTMTEQSYAACTTYKDVVYVEGADHGASFMVEPERVIRAEDAFFERIGF